MIRHKDARGCYSATVVKVLDTGDQNVLQRLVKGSEESATPVNHSSQNKTRALVAQSCKDGEKALTCVKLKRTSCERKLKKSGTDGSTSNDKAVCSAVMMVRPTLG